MNFDNDLVSFENENSDLEFAALLIGLAGLKKGWLRFDKPRKIKNTDSKISILKSLGFSSVEVGNLLGLKNVRQTQGWKGK